MPDVRRPAIEERAVRPGGPMKEADKAAVAASQEDALVKARADVEKVRERTRRKRVARLFIFLLVISSYLFYRRITNNPIRLPHIPTPLLFGFPMILLAGVILMQAIWMLHASRSP